MDNNVEIMIMMRVCVCRDVDSTMNHESLFRRKFMMCLADSIAGQACLLIGALEDEWNVTLLSTERIQSFLYFLFILCCCLSLFACFGSKR